MDRGQQLNDRATRARVTEIRQGKRGSSLFTVTFDCRCVPPNGETHPLWDPLTVSAILLRIWCKFDSTVCLLCAAVCGVSLPLSHSPNHGGTFHLCRDGVIFRSRQPCHRRSAILKPDVSDSYRGEGPLHVVAKKGNVEAVRLLLQRNDTDINLTDYLGYTPLMATCDTTQACADVAGWLLEAGAHTSLKPNHGLFPLDAAARIEVARLLLEAGADPTLATNLGFIPMHAAVHSGNQYLVDMLYSSAPTSLNHRSEDGFTPLFVACLGGSGSMVSNLISRGGMHHVNPDGMKGTCPLVAAIINDHVDVVRVLVREGGITAIGGGEALASALKVAVKYRRTIILQLMLTVGGEERRSEWANINAGGARLVHVAAAYCYSAAMSILLNAGADDEARYQVCLTARDIIGRSAPWNDLRRADPHHRDPSEEVAIRRMLDRGPAYRARSWAWPLDEKGDRGGHGDGDDGCAASAAAPLGPTDMTPPCIKGMQCYKPKEKQCRQVFVRVIDRYCAKEKPSTCSSRGKTCLLIVLRVMLGLLFYACLISWMMSVPYDQSQW